MTMICPKCKSEKVYYDGVYITCYSCSFTEWAKVEEDGHITNLGKKWSEEEVGYSLPEAQAGCAEGKI